MCLYTENYYSLMKIYFLLFTKIEVCDPPCVNGVCEEGNQCDCMPGWTGTICDNGIVLLNIIIISVKPILGLYIRYQIL